MNPLVSILIPAYNSEKYIAATLESALRQTWKRKEIIVLDDGSNDNTYSLAKRYASHGVLVIKQKNQGAAATRNNLYAASQGDYIQWLDADDILSDNKIECQLGSLRGGDSEKTLLSVPWGYFYYRTKCAKFSRSLLWADLDPAEWLVRKFSQNLFMQTATWLTSRELMNAAGPWDPEMLSDDDGEFFSRVLLASNGVRFSEEGKVYYRIAPSGRLSHIGTSDKKKDAMVRSLKLHIGYLRSLEDNDRARSACLQYMQNWLIYFYPERGDLVDELQGVARELGGAIVRSEVALEICMAKTMLWMGGSEAHAGYGSSIEGLSKKVVGSCLGNRGSLRRGQHVSILGALNESIPKDSLCDTALASSFDLCFRT